MKKNKRMLLLGGDGLSAFGAWIDFLAILTLAAYQYQVSAYQMAVVSAAGLLPGMLLGPALGRGCDRGDPRRLLQASIALRLAITGGILGCADYGLFLLLVGLRSVFAAVAPPAINVLAVRSVPVQDRQRFYAQLNVVNSAAKVLAPVVGAAASSFHGEPLALGLSLALSAAAWGVFGLLPPALQRVEEQGATAGASQVGVAGPVLPLLWIGATQAFMTFCVNNLVPVMLQQGGIDKGMLGLLVACSGAGNILSGLWLARRAAMNRCVGRPGELVAPLLAQAAGFGLMGAALAPGAALAVIVWPPLFFAIGTASARFAVALNVYLGTHHASTMGAASGRLQSWQQAMIFVAPLVGAWVLERWGATALFGFAAAAGGVSMLLFWLWAGRVRKAAKPACGA